MAASQPSFSPGSVLLLLQVWIPECSPAHFLHRFPVFQYVSKEPDLHQQSLERLRMFVPMRASGLLLQSPGLPTSLYGKELPLHSLAWALLLPVSISLLLYSSSWDHAPNQPHKSSSVRLNCKWDPDEDSCILIFKNSTIQTSLRSKKSILNHLSSQISMN